MTHLTFFGVAHAKYIKLFFSHILDVVESQFSTWAASDAASNITCIEYRQLKKSEMDTFNRVSLLIVGSTVVRRVNITYELLLITL